MLSDWVRADDTYNLIGLAPGQISAIINADLTRQEDWYRLAQRITNATIGA